MPPAPVLAQTEPANQPLLPPAAQVGIPEPAQAPPPATQNPPEPVQSSIDPFPPSKRHGELLTSHSPDRTSVPEIEAQLGVAIRRYQRASQLLEKKSISREEYEAALDEVRLLVARLKGLREELNEEIDRATIELRKKQAEVKLAEARQKATAVLVARNARLNERKKGIVSQEDVAKDESVDAANVAQIEVRLAEVQEVELRIKQYIARRDSIAKALGKTPRGLVTR